MESVEIAGMVVLAVSGVIAVAGRPLDLFGALVVGVVTALGGGTMRDLILGVAPVFWVGNELYLATAIAGAVVAIPLARALIRTSARRLEESLKLADAAGLSLFAIVGATVALDHGFSATIAVVSGLLTGVGGGMIRDVLSGRTPLILRGEIYATAALAGAVTFVLLHELGIPEPVAGVLGGLTTFSLRVVGIRRQWALPSLAAESRS